MDQAVVSQLSALVFDRDEEENEKEGADEGRPEALPVASEVVVRPVARDGVPAEAIVWGFLGVEG